jgi:glycosyltransferase involved in cell wall biosynthesis
MLTAIVKGDGVETGRIRALVPLNDDPQRWAACVISLVDAGASVYLQTGNRDVAEALFGHLPVEIGSGTSDSVINESFGLAWSGADDAVLLVHSPVVVPPDAFAPALKFLRDDIRIATVSFWSNNAYYLSFPFRNHPVGLTPDGHSESTLTAALRAEGRTDSPVPIPIPAGGAVLVSTLALRAVGTPQVGALSLELAIADFALRASRRGFRHVLDASTYVTRPLVQGGRPDDIDNPGGHELLHARHPTFPTLVEQTRTSRTAPLATALASAVATVRGLSVLIDGSCLGPYEMGTQVQTLALVRALSARDDIREVVVPLNNEGAPGYARDALAHPKVRTCLSSNWTFPDVAGVDIVHRPYQPDAVYPWSRWRDVGHRTVVTLQDLIAYDNGYYHSSGQAWLTYRDAIEQGAGFADAVVTISNDVAQAIRQAGLAVADERLYIVENGTDHPMGELGVERPPVEILERNMMTMPFLLTLGASYAHKNRDLSIATWRELTRRGHQIELVLAGVVVPFGSSRDDEALAASRGGVPITLPDVTSEERNWLMRHAAVALYPTSAEGFGLVPFEAARFGTPTAFVNFGPLAEVLANAPVTAADWSPQALADVVEALLRDPELANRQVQAALKSGEQYTWDVTAEKLVTIYKSVLSAPRGLI